MELIDIYANPSLSNGRVNIGKSMCGVTGRLRVVGYTPSSGGSSELHNAVAALAHRGPDDSGEWSDAAAGISLGHR